MTAATASPAPPRRISLASLLVVAIVSATFLYFALRSQDWRRLWSVISEARPQFIALAGLLFSCSYCLRSLRWKVILDSAAPISVQAVFRAEIAGYIGNNFLPARAGELIRSMMVASKAHLSNTFVLATALTERMFDSLALVLISATALQAIPYAPHWLMRASRVIAGFGLAAILAIAFLPRLERWVEWIVSKLPSSGEIGRRLRAIPLKFLAGMMAYRNPMRAATFAVLTAVIWLTDAMVAKTIATSLHLSLNLSFALLLLAGLGLSSALPSTPGYLGVYQFVAIGILNPLGFSREQALAYILVFQALNYAVLLIWGVTTLPGAGLRAKLAWAQATGPQIAIPEAESVDPVSNQHVV